MNSPAALDLAREHGICVSLDNGGALKLHAPRTPPPEVLAALRRHKAEIVAYLQERRAQEAAGKPAATVEPMAPALSRVEVWRAGIASLDPAIDPCPGFATNSWPAIYAQIARFLDPAWPFARLAAETGWTELELFGVHREVGTTRLDTLGALLVTTQPVTQVTPQLVRFLNGLASRRMPMNPEHCVVVWDFGNYYRTLARI
jgi:hypothetical protein